MTRESVVPPVSQQWLAAAGAAVVGAFTVTGWEQGIFVIVGLLGFGFSPKWRAVALVPVMVVALSTFHAVTFLDQGPIDTEVSLSSDAKAGPFGHWATARVGDVALFLDMPDPIEMERGSVVHLTGQVKESTTMVAGRPHQVVDVETSALVKAPGSPYARLGNATRSIVAERFSDRGESAALLAGFLVGDVSGVSPATRDAMRLAGLSHFVAVSGSNVALFLGLVYLVVAPFAISPRLRAAAGLACLPIFVVATGFEPSVIRASAMASLILVGRIGGIELEVWQVFSLALVGLVFIDPWLVRSVGFQLSVAATAGVVVGSRWPGIKGKVGRALAVTSGAQLSVAPLLLIHFGTLPLLAPISNLAAAPLVSLATALAIPAALGFVPASLAAEFVAGIVIDVAHTAAAWPQIGWVGLVVAVLSIPLLAAISRRPAALAAALLVAFGAFTFWGDGPPEQGTVIVLDVGQGDAILLSGGDGAYALVDGGSDEAVLLRHLRERGITSLGLVVMTHGDSDHSAGLAGLFGRVSIGTLWEKTAPHVSTGGQRVLELAARYGVPVANPVPGTKAEIGSLLVEVVGPGRRYKLPNDQSIVLVVSGERRSMLLTGDIEAVTQNEMSRVDVDVLKVPHHGAATSDPRWLSGLGVEQAVISVGENTFGHPVEWVVAALESAGAIVQRTDQEGSIVIDLDDEG